MTFFPVLPSVNENSERESNPMSWLLQLYLSGSAFLVSFTDPNKAKTKNTLVSGWQEKSSPGRLQIYFLNRFN